MDNIELDLSNLDRHIQGSFNAIKLLFEYKHFDQARYCAYILIDQLAWLVSGSEQQVNIYFKNWLEKYFKPFYPEITPEEIWASRNGLLHNGSSISRDIINGRVARQLYYIDNLNSEEEVSHKFKLSCNTFFPVNTTRFLQVALYGAVQTFRNNLDSDTNMDRIEVKQKLGKLLAPIYP
ncbi:hypothetical protein [Acinetobacter guillouiae]|uniref:hypothetical protein n=1 Tax=Acinetobacter guillouiae TaxID=106649 RepID=UPI002E24C04A